MQVAEPTLLGGNQLLENNRMPFVAQQIGHLDEHLLGVAVRRVESADFGVVG